MEILKSGKPDEEGRAHQPCRARADFRRVQSLECSLEPEWRGTWEAFRLPRQTPMWIQKTCEDCPLWEKRPASEEWEFAKESFLGAGEGGGRPQGSSYAACSGHCHCLTFPIHYSGHGPSPQHSDAAPGSAVFSDSRAISRHHPPWVRKSRSHPQEEKEFFNQPNLFPVPEIARTRTMQPLSFMPALNLCRMQEFCLLSVREAFKRIRIRGTKGNPTYWEATSMVFSVFISFWCFQVLLFQEMLAKLWAEKQFFLTLVIE